MTDVRLSNFSTCIGLGVAYPHKIGTLNQCPDCGDHNAAVQSLAIPQDTSSGSQGGKKPS